MEDNAIDNHLHSIAEAEQELADEQDALKTMYDIQRMERRLGRELDLFEKFDVIDALASPKPSTKRFIDRWTEDQIPF